MLHIEVTYDSDEAEMRRPQGPYLAAFTALLEKIEVKEGEFQIAVLTGYERMRHAQALVIEAAPPTLFYIRMRSLVNSNQVLDVRLNVRNCSIDHQELSRRLKLRAMIMNHDRAMAIEQSVKPFSDLEQKRVKLLGMKATREARLVTIQKELDEITKQILEIDSRLAPPK